MDEDDTRPSELCPQDKYAGAGNSEQRDAGADQDRATAPARPVRGCGSGRPDEVLPDVVEVYTGTELKIANERIRQLEGTLAGYVAAYEPLLVQHAGLMIDALNTDAIKDDLDWHYPGILPEKCIAELRDRLNERRTQANRWQRRFK